MFTRITEIKDSSQIAEVSYDIDELLLKIQFKNGAVYIYSDVPRIHYSGLVSSTSVGEYFNVNIKHGFTYAKMKGVVNEKV
jgi:hypothetical protein